MNKKILLLLFVIFIISIMFISCKKFDTTATTIENQGNTYVSIDPILGQDYKLSVKTEAKQIIIGIAGSDGTLLANTAEETIDKVYQEKGSSNYSFQNGVMSGNFSVLSGDQIKISFVRNTPPYLSVRDIICAKKAP